MSRPGWQLTTPCGVLVAIVGSALIVAALAALWYAAELVAR